MDQDEIEDRINARASIHLFGHKHRQRATLEQSYVRIYAAAVNPERYQAEFEQGYNLIELHVRGKGVDRVLDIEAHLRHWQKNPDLYRSRLNAQPRRNRLARGPFQVADERPHLCGDWCLSMRHCVFRGLSGEPEIGGGGVARLRRDGFECVRRGFPAWTKLAREHLLRRRARALDTADVDISAAPMATKVGQGLRSTLIGGWTRPDPSHRR
jgi:hypothetical protein